MHIKDLVVELDQDHLAEIHGGIGPPLPGGGGPCGSDPCEELGGPISFTIPVMISGGHGSATTGGTESPYGETGS
ncbi:MAG: hypothetical protein U9P00_08940, partial [Pseudomonadota bacterium]|nr:hypothetical protein [Pseudomonadota bacterium]